MTEASGRMEWNSGVALQVKGLEDGRVELAFENNVPPLTTIKVEVINNIGKCRALLIPPTLNGTVAVASGKTEGMYRARVSIMEQGRLHIRETNLPGFEPVKAVKGPNGGALVMIGHEGEGASAEVVQQGDDWKIVFADSGKPVKAPPPNELTVEAIGPSSLEDQVRYLTVSAGSDSSSLMAKGDTAGAVYVRLSTKDGPHWHERCVPLK